MRNKMGNVLWGVVFIALGVLLTGNTLFGWEFNLFFDGWWTLFIIIPSLISIIQNGMNTSAVIGLIFGGVFFLDCIDAVPNGVAFRLIVPFILIAIGVKIMFRNNFSKKVEANCYHDDTSTYTSGKTMEGEAVYGPDSIENSDGKKTDYQSHTHGFQTGADYSAFFSSNRANFDGEVFKGTSANAIFGGVVLDLRGAIIDQDVVINATAIFGGIDIYVPYGVKVKVNNIPIFGGVSNKSAGQVKADAPTIYLQSTCMFGGIDIK